jgi:DNA-binding MarR family transcriptional regulator
MHPISHTHSTPEAVKLLQRIIHLRSHFKVVVPENISTIKRQIHESNLTGKGAGFNDASLFYIVSNVFSRYTGPISMGELSRDLEVPLSTATRTMDWLVTNGYAQRLPDSNDRRIVRVELTETGKETYQAISTFMLERVEQALSMLTQAEQDIFLALLNKVLNAFEEAA